MQNPTDSDSRSPPRSSGLVSRAPVGAENKTAQPPLTSGFGTVIEKEQALQTATEGSLGYVDGLRATEIDRILQHQQSRVAANIALLEQRYEALPKPERFVDWQHRSRPPVAARRTAPDGTHLLPDLIARHIALLEDIRALIVCAPDGQRGELILTEVSRSHEEMAWMLTALLREDESIARMTAEGEGPAPDPTAAQEKWDTDGGAPRT